MEYRLKSDSTKVSLLGYGAMRMPAIDGGHANNFADNASKAGIDQEELNRQIKYLLDSGVTYFDTSPAYCRGLSEKCLGEALLKSGYDRKDYLIVTKLSNFSPSQFSLEKCQKMFYKSLENLRTDYIDNYLLHSVGNGGLRTFKKRYIDNGALEWCAKMRGERKIRNLGFSFHGDRKVWEWCLENHDKYKWDFCMIQLNYIDWYKGEAKKLYDEATEKKIPVVVMEPLLGGRLARYNWALAHELAPLDPEASLARWALRFCGSLDNVMCILSGMTYMEHMEENVKTFSPLKKLSSEESAAVKRAAEKYGKIKTIPCNSCNYCMPCPYGLDIPQILTFKNLVAIEEAKRSESGGKASGAGFSQWLLKTYDKMVPNKLRRADHCTGCARCNPHCPQYIDVAKEMDAIDKLIERAKNEVY